MRYFSYIAFDFLKEEEFIDTISEDEFREKYYPALYEQACNAHGSEYINKNYCFWDFLDIWMITNRAWELN